MVICKDAAVGVFALPQVKLTINSLLPLDYKNTLDPDRQKTIQTADLYLCADFDTSHELDALALDVTKAPYTPQTRYDAQFVERELL